MGDFNEVLYQGEAVGRSVRQAWQLKAFGDALTYCRLFDLGYSGALFTWSSSTFGSPWSRARLDRVCSFTSWSPHFSKASVLYLQNIPSDHLPLLLSLVAREDGYWRRSSS